MAKSKSKPKSKKVLDDEDDVDQVKQDAESSEEVAVDVEDDAGIDVAIDDDEAPPSKSDDGDDDDDDGESSMDEAPKKPTPKMTGLTKTLLGLNIFIGVPVFLAALMLDNDKHTAHVYRAIYNHALVLGLPLENEETVASLAQEMRPVMRLTPEQLKKAFTDRRTGFSVPGNEPFLMVEEPIPVFLRPSDMTDSLVKDLFRDVSDPVPTLDAEIKRLEGVIPGAIEAAAKEVLDQTKSADEKRSVIRKVLFPIAWDVWQVKRLNNKLIAAKDEDLDAILTDAVQRRMYYDILAPINLFRPGADGDYKIEKIASVDPYDQVYSDESVQFKAYSIDDLKGFLKQRLEAALKENYDPEVHLGKRWPSEAMKRDNIERRQVIAFTLFTLGQAQVPTLNKALFPKGLDRAQVVSGINDFTSASVRYVLAMQTLQKRIADAINADRDGVVLSVKGSLTRTNGFITEYEAEVQRLIGIVESIDTAQKRIADLKTQRDHLTKIYEQRDLQHKATMKKLLDVRKETETIAQNLRGLQGQLHEALLELSEAANRNFRLEAEIRAIELKGAK
jgi:hypothetical protein